MRLSDMLEQVDIYVPNSLNNRLKISFINQVQDQLYRDYPLPRTFYRFFTAAGMQHYIMPNDFQQDNVISVSINEKDANLVPLNDAASYGERESYVTFIENVLFVNPERPPGQVVYVYYKPAPFTLSEDNLNEEPAFYKDFHEILVFGCAVRVAMSLPEPDYDRVRFLEGEYQKAVERSAILRKSKQTKVFVRRSWR